MILHHGVTGSGATYVHVTLLHSPLCMLQGAGLVLSLESSTDGDAKAKFKRYSVHVYVRIQLGVGGMGMGSLCCVVCGWCQCDVWCEVVDRMWWAGCLLAHGSPLCTVAHSEEVVSGE